MLANRTAAYNSSRPLAGFHESPKFTRGTHVSLDKIFKFITYHCFFSAQLQSETKRENKGKPSCDERWSLFGEKRWESCVLKSP